MRNRPTFLAASCTVAVALGGLVVAAPASAQQASSGAAPGLRYLGWSGKPAQAAPGMPVPAGQDGLRRYPGIIPRQSAAPMSSAPMPLNAAPVSMASAGRPSRYGPTPVNRLTPASVWLNNAPAPAPYAEALPPPAYAPPPPAYPRQPAYQPQPVAAPVPRPVYTAAPAPAPQPTYLPSSPARGPITTSAPADAPMSAYADAPVPALAAPQPGFEAAFDPMAPRRDAPIFRMGRDAPTYQNTQVQGAAQPGALSDGSAAPLPMATQPQGQQQQPPAQYAPAAYAANEPPREGPRYYSVHRAAGHQPDATRMPEAVYLDSAPVASGDLAEPPETPLPGRTVNGRVQNIVPNEDPSLP